MADTGYNWGSWSFMQIGSGNWDDDDVADGVTDTGDATSLDGKAGCIVSIQAVEDNTGAISGDVTVHILGDTDGTNYEEPGVGGAFSFNFTPVQNDTVHVTFNVDPRKYDSFKIALENNSGQTLTMDVRYKTATIPVAS
jgi:hypothetical protein